MAVVMVWQGRVGRRVEWGLAALAVLPAALWDGRGGWGKVVMGHQGVMTGGLGLPSLALSACQHGRVDEAGGVARVVLRGSMGEVARVLHGWRAVKAGRTGGA